MLPVTTVLGDLEVSTPQITSSCHNYTKLSIMEIYENKILM